MSGILTINLSAIQANWRLLAERVGNQTEVGAVVKANAYGLGVMPVAGALFDVGCRTFFVAVLAEAIALKAALSQNGGDCQIIILTGVREVDIPICIESNFIPVLASLSQCQQWAATCRRIGAQSFSAVKVDTGMHRLGLDVNEFAELINDPQLLLACSPILLMSHLACAELPDHSLNRQQLNCFNDQIRQVKKIVPTIAVSFANSSGVFLGSDYHFDIVRPGVSLYGVNPTPHLPNPMQNVVQLRLPILQIKTIVGPASVGYDATYTIPKGEQRRLAIAGGGYADGVFVHCSNSGSGLIAGKKIPMVGRVSMDSTIFDISEIDEALLEKEENACITVLDQHHDLDQFALEAGTIGYEVLTALGHRYHREYID